MPEKEIGNTMNRYSAERSVGLSLQKAPQKNKYMSLGIFTFHYKTHRRICGACILRTARSFRMAQTSSN